jgi:hypothetical protein
MTELRKKVLDEIDSLYRFVNDDTNLQNNLSILYDYIKNKDNLKDDQDIRIFLYTNKDHAAVKPFSNIDDSDYTAINQIITGKEPNLIKEDIKLKEVFGETYAEPGVLERRKGQELKKLTDASKVDFYEALKAVEDEEVKKAREDIFGWTNWLQKIFTPRTYERRMSGDDAELKDLGLDVLENAAYTFLPTGRVVGKVLPKIPGVGKVIEKVKPVADKVLNPVKDKVDKVSDNTLAKVAGYVANAAAAPFAMEGIDALAYDDNENTDRKDFSLIDGSIGAGVNLLTPMVIKGPAGGIARILGGEKYGPKMGEVISKAGYGKTISNISKDAAKIGKQKKNLLRAERGVQNQKQFYDALVKDAENSLDDAIKTGNNLEIAKAEQYLEFVKTYKAEGGEVLNTFVQDLKAFRDKFKYNEYDDRLLKYIRELENLKNTQKFKKGPTLVGTYKQKAKLVDEVLETSKLDDISKYNARNELLDILKDVKFDSDIAAEKFILDFVSNKLGDIQYKDRASSLPVIGEALKSLNERELKEKRQKVRDSFAKMLLPEPDTKKESK